MPSYSHFRMVVFLVLLGLMGPPLLYGLLFLGAPSISPERAREFISREKEQAVIVDVRQREEYEKFSLKEAINIPLDLLKTQPQGPWHQALQNKKHIFVICSTGFLSARATDVLHALGLKQALNVRGGLDAWISVGKRASQREVMVFRTSSGEMTGLKQLSLTLLEQVTICVAAFCIKPLYELFSFIIVLLLWKSQEIDLVPLRRAMIAFFLGENACALNFLFFNEQSLLLEFLHMYGMLICFGLTIFALMKAVDLRMIHFSDETKKCALLSLCKRCYKYQAVSCNLRLLFLIAIPSTAILAFMPLTADLGSYFYNGKVFGDDVLFGHFTFQQVLEVRLFPLASLLFSGIALIPLLKSKEKGLETSKILFAIGLGPLSFSLMRFVTFWAYSQNPLWAESWEEITEALFIALVFWIVLRVKQGARTKENIAQP